MKNIKYQMAGLALALMLVLLDSCKNLTDGYSADPVEITDRTAISVNQYLSGIEISLVAAYEGDIVLHAGIWSDYFNGSDRQFIGVGNYIVTSETMDNTWELIYQKVMKNHLLLQEKALAENNLTALGISQINLALAIGLAADLWGDVPYSEAGQFPAILNPKYEPQSSVYAAAQKLLDNGIANVAKNIGKTNGDFFLNAGSAKWIKAAHSAKARYYLHTKEYQNAIAEALLGIDEPAGNVMATHGDANLKDFNLYYSFLVYERPGYMSANCFAPTLLDAKSKNYRGNSKTDETARLNWYYAPGGLDLLNQDYEPNYSCPDAGYECTGFFGNNTSFPLLTFEETKLILAESYMKQPVADPAKALEQLNLLRRHYNTGAPFKNSSCKKTSYKYDDYALGDFALGGLANAKGEEQNTALLREILEERYVSFIGQFEGWADMRRTKNFLGLPLPTGKNDFPKRMLYPQIEVNTNTNTPQGVGIFKDVPSFASPY